MARIAQHSRNRCFARPEHLVEAVYDYLLKLARVRFLLADDAGAGKTIMSGLLVRELALRGLAERILIVCPANLAFQWQREMKEKFDTTFLVMKGQDLREQFGVNQWLEELKRDAQISPRPPVVLGGLLVVPQGLVDKMVGRPEPSVVRPDDTLVVAARARDIVMETERGLGFEPTDRELDKLGYDIESRDPATGKLRFIEVKGRRSDADTVTRHEERDPVLAEQAGRLHPRSRPVRQRRRRHPARALRPAAVPAGTGLRGGECQLRAQGPAGHRRGSAARAGSSRRA